MPIINHYTIRIMYIYIYIYSLYTYIHIIHPILPTNEKLKTGPQNEEVQYFHQVARVFNMDVTRTFGIAA